MKAATPATTAASTPTPTAIIRKRPLRFESEVSPWQRLNFLPLPHEQSSLRPGLDIRVFLESGRSGGSGKSGRESGGFLHLTYLAHLAHLTSGAPL